MKVYSIKITNESKKILIIISLLAYKFILDGIYKIYLSDRWLFMGFSNNGTINSYVLSWLLYILMCPFVYKNLSINNTSSMFITLFNIIYFIPSLVIVGQYKYPSNEFLILFITYWLLINILNLVIPQFKIKKVSSNNMIYFIITFLVIATILLTSYKYTGFRIDLNIFNAYTYRYESEEYNMSNVLEYLFAISRNVLPILIVEKLVNKKYIWSILFLFIGLLAYSVTGSKSVLFSYILVFIGYFFYTNEKIKYFPGIMIVLLTISIVELVLFKKSYIIDVFIRRVLFIPGLLSYYYYDFFRFNTFDYFRQGVLGKIGFTSPYVKPIPKMIGELYFMDSYANVGLLSDSYYNLGIPGVIIMPLFIILLVKLFESVSSGLDDRIVFAGSITVIFSLINSSFFTALITHGVLGTIILLYFMNKKGI